MPCDLYIIAAGAGSRLGGNVPKALIPITDEPCLTTTFKQIGHKFAHVFVVINNMVTEQWEQYQSTLAQEHPALTKNVVFIPISSGLGDGHAVLQGFLGVQNLKDTRPVSMFSNDVVIMWGDVFIQHAELFDELMSRPLQGSGLIPAVREETPYVTLLVDDYMHCMSADFSKYGENHPTGLHDQSVFRFSRETLWHVLTVLSAAFWKNEKYITPGGELSLLHAFHYLYNVQQAVEVYETHYPTCSFNTPAEVASIQLEINAKWHKTHQSS